MDGWENWIFITGMCEDTVELENGTNYKEFVFNGREIFNSMRNGPYKIWIGIENASNWHMVTNIEFDTAAYDYNEFSAASGGVRIKKENMSFGTVDYMNGSYLTVNVTVVKTTEGTETLWLDGGLEYVDDQHGIWEWITGTGREISLDQGNNTFPLNFNAGEISNSGRDGPYRVWLNIRDDSSWMDVDNYEYTTAEYNAADAPEPPIRFVELGPEDSYINGSMFVVNVSVNVTDAAFEGEYDLHGGVHFQHQDGWWEHITGGGNWMMLENGTNTVEFSFNAGEINQRLPEDYNGPLSIFMGINQMGNWEEVARYDYETRSYTKDDFPGPEVTMQITDAQPNGSYFTVNVTVEVESGSAGEYDLHGGVNWIDNSNGWDEWRFITGTGQPINLDSGTNNVQLNFNGGEIYQVLQQEDVTSRLSIWMGINSMQSWMELTHDDYMTPEEFSYTDFSPPQLTIECISDYNNNTDYLTINVSINASGDMLGQEYDIHAGIHWKSGWEWRFITGYGQPLVIDENMTFSLNFNGGAIRACEHDGPYEVWVGISSMDSWQDLTHDEYSTQPYSYTEFAAPSVQILRGNLESYVNGSTALTLNVTVNATETGTYFLEGGLDWVDGFHWQWIGWTGQDITIDSVGEHTFALNFNAQDLKRAADEGWTGQELVAWLGVMNTSNWQEISRIDDCRLTGYSPDDFATIPIQFGDGDITDEGVESIPYSELEVTVPLNVSSAGDYEIIAGLFDEMTNTLIAKTNESITGTPSSITVSFNGTKINKKQINGTYELRAKLMNSSSKTEYDRGMWFTTHYDYTDFEEAVPEAYFENEISSNISTGDLQVSVVVNVTQTGNQFEIYGELFDENGTFIAFASTTEWLNTTGNHTINLLFDGTKINTAELNGPYVLEFLRLSIDEEFGWGELDHKIDSHTTAAYEYSSFGGGPL